MDAENRDRMVARVQETYAQYPTFMSLPEASSGNIQWIVMSDDNSEYVRALHEVCARGVVVGRGLNTLFGQADEASE
jgi:hypothetical protein